MGADFTDGIQNYNGRDNRQSLSCLSFSGTSFAVAENESGIARATVAQPGSFHPGIPNCGLAGSPRSVGDVELEFAKFVWPASSSENASGSGLRCGVTPARPQLLLVAYRQPSDSLSLAISQRPPF